MSPLGAPRRERDGDEIIKTVLRTNDKEVRKKRAAG